MTRCSHAVFAALMLFAACQSEVEPVPLYDGEWIDVGGVGRERSDTCVGTFGYVDAYAGVLAAEFGIDGPIGTFIWYTPEEFDARLPCSGSSLYPAACAHEDAVQSAFFPDVHEMVHVAHYHYGLGPSALTEGIAVYYSTEISEGQQLTSGALTSRLAAPSETIPLGEYEMLGRFAGFLIERHGLQAVLDVCAAAGRDASGAQLAAAMQSILGETPDELITALSQEPAHCNDFYTYRSKLFACGVAAAAPSLGSFVDGHLEARLDFGCDETDVVGPFEGGPNYGNLVRTLSLEIPAADHYWFRVYDETQADEPIPAGIEFVASQCAPCGDWARGSADVEGSFPLLGDFDAGRYSVEISMPEDYLGTVRLEIN